MNSILINEQYLKIPCEPVNILDDVSKIIYLLDESLKKSNTYGIGLAAPQIGIYKNVAIVRYRNTLVDLVNAKIISKKDPIVFSDEGCLSFPNKKIKSIRFNEIELFNAGVIKTYKGMEAIVIQHELDHLNGIVLEDIDLAKVKANDLCPCESGKEYKKCHQKIVKKMK